MAFQIAWVVLTGLRFVVIDMADVLDREKRKMLISLLLNGDLDQAIVLATSEEAPPLIVPQGVKFLSLGERTRSGEALLSTAVPRSILWGCQPGLNREQLGNTLRPLPISSETRSSVAFSLCIRYHI